MKQTDDRASINRANAAKSTGPRSVQGKAIAARNSITHGLSAKSCPGGTSFSGVTQDGQAPSSGSWEDFRRVEGVAAALLDQLARWQDQAAGSEASPLRSTTERLEALDGIVDELRRLDRYRTPRQRAWIKTCLAQAGFARQPVGPQEAE